MPERTSIDWSVLEKLHRPAEKEIIGSYSDGSPIYAISGGGDEADFWSDLDLLDLDVGASVEDRAPKSVGDGEFIPGLDDVLGSLEEIPQGEAETSREAGAVGEGKDFWEELDEEPAGKLELEWRKKLREGFRSVVNGVGDWLGAAEAYKNWQVGRRQAVGEQRVGILQKVFGRKSGAEAGEPKQNFWKWLGDAAIGLGAKIYGLPAEALQGLKNMRLKERLASVKLPHIEKEQAAEFLRTHGANALFFITGAGVRTGLALAGGVESAWAMDGAALGLAGLGFLGIVEGNRSIENVQEAANLFVRAEAGIRRLCAEKAAKGIFRAMAYGGGGFAAAGLTQDVMYIVSNLAGAGSGAEVVQPTPAPAPGGGVGLPTEVPSYVSTSGSENVARFVTDNPNATQNAIQAAAENTVRFMSESANFGSWATGTINQAYSSVAGLDPSSIGVDSGVQEVVKQASAAFSPDQSQVVIDAAQGVVAAPENQKLITDAQAAIQAAVDYQTQAASGGFTPAEQAELQSKISAAQTLVDQLATVKASAVEAAKTAAQGVVDAIKQAADWAAQAAAETARLAAEQAALQASADVLSAGKTMAELAVNTAQGTPHEAVYNYLAQNFPGLSGHTGQVTQGLLEALGPDKFAQLTPNMLSEIGKSFAEQLKNVPAGAEAWQFPNVGDLIKAGTQYVNPAKIVEMIPAATKLALRL